MANWPCQWGYGYGKKGGDDSIGGYWVSNFCPHHRVLHRMWVEDPFTKGLLHLEGTGCVPIPYKGYVEASLTVLGLPWYNDDVLFLVIPDN